jgi:hypothetical protein
LVEAVAEQEVMILLVTAEAVEVVIATQLLVLLMVLAVR